MKFDFDSQWFLRRRCLKMFMDDKGWMGQNSKIDLYLLVQLHLHVLNVLIIYIKYLYHKLQ